MTVSLHSAASSHADHRHWKSDLETWANDLANWRSEHTEAMEALQRATQALAKHCESLDEHESAMKELELGLEHHEKHLSSSLASGSSSDIDDDLQERHEQQSGSFNLEKATHERIKRNHHRAMAQIAILEAVVKSSL